jgi:hypothetical protein
VSAQGVQIRRLQSQRLDVRHVVAEAAIGSGQSGTLAVACPKGWTLGGGGFASDRPLTVLQSSSDKLVAPSPQPPPPPPGGGLVPPRAWVVRAENNGSGMATAAVESLCLSIGLAGR